MGRLSSDHRLSERIGHDEQSDVVLNVTVVLRLLRKTVTINRAQSLDMGGRHLRIISLVPNGDDIQTERMSYGDVHGNHGGGYQCLKV